MFHLNFASLCFEQRLTESFSSQTVRCWDHQESSTYLLIYTVQTQNKTASAAFAMILNFRFQPHWSTN